MHACILKINFFVVTVSIQSQRGNPNTIHLIKTKIQRLTNQPCYAGGGEGWLVQDTRQMMFFFVSNSLNAGNVDKQYNRL